MPFSRCVRVVGVDINARKTVGSGRTALHDAADRGHSQCARALVDLGADIHAGAVARRSTTPATAILSSAQQRSALIAAGVDVGVKDLRGSTALHFAAWRGGAQLLAVLIAAGADFHELNLRGQSPHQICIGLQSLRISALQTCEILVCACGPVAPLVPFHVWWRIATTVKHRKHGAIH